MENSKQPACCSILGWVLPLFTGTGQKLVLQALRTAGFCWGRQPAAGLPWRRHCTLRVCTPPPQVTVHWAEGKQNLGFIAEILRALKAKGRALKGLGWDFQSKRGQDQVCCCSPSPIRTNFSKTCVSWLFKDPAGNLVPYLGIETENGHFRNLFLVVCMDFFWSLSFWAQLCCLNTDKTPTRTIIMAVSGENYYGFAGRAMKYFKINKPFTCTCFMKSCL